MFNISNHACLIGTLEAEPTVSKEQDGGIVASFTLACRDNFLKRDGSESVQYLPVCKAIAAGDEAGLAEIKALKPGTLLGVSAQLAGQSWTDNDGYARQELKIAALDVKPVQ